MASTFLRLVLISIPVAAFVIYFAMHGRSKAQREAHGPDTPAQKSAAEPTP
jgi:heme/copper-type cytochrome/quinol oxidase subunit 2